ncbi:MAG: hypothetical protein AB1714_14795 [Acidobacteriota bacterium]
MTDERGEPVLKRDPRATNILAMQVAAELILFLLPVICSALTLFCLKLFLQDAIRRMDGLPRWLLLISVVAASLAVSSYAVGASLRRYLPPLEYTLWTSTIFGLLVLLTVMLWCIGAEILFLYSLGISLAAGILIFVAVGIPLMAGKARGRRK